MRSVVSIVMIALVVPCAQAFAGQPADRAGSSTTLVLKAFPLTGQTEGLEPEVLDLRYAPGRWQACIGLPDDPYKTIVGSDGGLYYDYGGQGPAAYNNGQGTFGTRVLSELQATGRPGPRRQTLHSPRIPIVVTEQEYGKLAFRQQAWAGVTGERGAIASSLQERTSRRVDFLWLTATNRGDSPATGKISLDVGTRTPLRLDATRTRLLEAGQAERVFCHFSRPCLPPGPKPLVLTWDLGTLSAGEAYDLLVTLPQGDQASRDPRSVGAPAALDAETEHRRAVAFWNEADLPFDRITVPDQAVQSLLDSCIRNIYQAREIKDGRPAFQVGPTCYRGTWAADGPFILEAITYLGRASEVRAGLEQQVDQDSGPGGVAFSKKSGLRLWMIRRHAQLTGDRPWLERMWPRVEREVRQIIQYRSMTRDDPKQANYGLMPVGFGDGGLGGQHREYTNVYWTLAGLRAAIEMAQQRHDPSLPAWQAEYQDYWTAFDKARIRDKLTDAAGNTYVPVTMKGEEPQLPQRGAWAFLQSVFPGRVFSPEDKLMLGTVAMLDANQREGLIFGTGWIADGIWNYAASFYAHAHLWLGHGRKAAATLYAFGNHACPLLCWREEQRPLGDPPVYVGDMPHNWASAEFIRLVRHLLILERGGELHLLEGLPRTWTRPGDVTRLKEIPTSFGPVSLMLRVAGDGQSATIQLDPPPTGVPSGSRYPERVDKLIVHLEHFDREIKSVRVDGKNLSQPTLEVPTDKPITVEIEFKLEGGGEKGEAGRRMP
jgi:hypothetical protein